MNATDYLRMRNIVQKDKEDLLIIFDDGSNVSLIELMDSYHEHRLSGETPNQKDE